MAEELVPMTKDGKEIQVHPLAVEDHKQLGWMVMEAAPVAEKSVAAPKAPSGKNIAKKDADE